MVTEKTHRSGSGMRYLMAKLFRRPQGCEHAGSRLVGMGCSQVGSLNRLWLLVLASVFMAGCSNFKTSPSIERDPCLDAGPAKSVEYENCVADRKASQSEALKELLDDTGAYSQGRQFALSDRDIYQESDFPDTPIPIMYRGAGSISAAEKRALPFKIRITWKYSSKSLLPAPRDRIRMDQMERLILPALQEKGLAKWACTVTGGQQREWIFYTRNNEAFIVQTKAVLAQTGPYPIELSARKEPVLSTEMHKGGNSPGDNRITPKSCVA
ncbi:DUF695 domain-containing protein [Pseudomonas amygdali]|uniref:DUF695 domain-containing protein n=1 Tax=Pseudomonas amygdali TaxID=47877 RepID=UPI000A62C0D7|nr:DUF695 domain-containing protein [Pseudomonas amygdali]